jgi:hypothetical protein
VAKISAFCRLDALSGVSIGPRSPFPYHRRTTAGHLLHPSSVVGSSLQSSSPHQEQLPTIIVDVVSIGSLSNQDSLERLRAQRATWASGVRNFWTVTEANDYDPACPDTVSKENVTAILQWLQSNVFAAAQE